MAFDMKETATTDPRFKNELPQAGTLQEYASAYADQLAAAIKSISSQTFDDVYAALENVIQNGKRVYVAGNGGSSAIADHLCCDWTKGTHVSAMPSLKTHSLSASVGLLTALSNDFSYEQAFERQLEMYAEKGDLVVLISSSGNSPNVVKAAQAARDMGATVLGLTGFSGGKLRELAHLSVHVPVNNYGIVEDAHQSVMHVLAQYLARARDKQK